MEEELNQPEVMQELILKLMNDFWNRPTFYDDDDDEYTIIYRKPKAITPDLPIEEPDNSLIMGDEHLDTIPEMKSLIEIFRSHLLRLIFLPEEFVGELDLIDLILPGIDFDEDDCDEADFDEEE
ncbi:hypothetical protein Tco_0328257 [Tanacetum coccineum]